MFEGQQTVPVKLLQINGVVYYVMICFCTRGVALLNDIQKHVIFCETINLLISMSNNIEEQQIIDM